MIKEKDLKVGHKYATEFDEIYTVKFIGAEHIVVEALGNKVLRPGEHVFSKENVLMFHKLIFNRYDTQNCFESMDV